MNVDIPAPMKLKSLSDIFSSADDKEELYASDQQIKNRRLQKGQFSRSRTSFNFLYLVKSWDKIVGKMLSENTIPLKIKQSTLVVLTRHSIFSQELGLMSPIIIEKIEEHFPSFKGSIKKIRFQNGDFTSDEFNKIQGEKQQSLKVQKKYHKFDPNYIKRKEDVSKMFEDVEDEEVKELLTSIAMLK